MLGSEAFRTGIPLPPPSADGSADVILDIDLDYFSVQDPVPRLIAAGWNNASLGELDRVVEQLCAPNEREEHWLAARIHEVVAGLGMARRAELHLPTLMLSRCRCDHIRV